MTDKELADRVVALGVGAINAQGWYTIKSEFVAAVDSLLANQFVRDWRVAGALIEKMIPDVHFPLYSIIANAITDVITGKSESLPRAIIEACVEALE